MWEKQPAFFCAAADSGDIRFVVAKWNLVYNVTLCDCETLRYKQRMCMYFVLNLAPIV